MRVVFAGTPAFAVPTLEALHHAGHEIVAVYNQPDRPAGRGRRLRPGPVKERALALGLAIRQPTSLKEPTELEALARLAPEVMVVVAYGLILPPPVLAIPRYGCINVHASLLPRWRGAAPIARAVEAGDAQTGVTIMQMDRGLDTGDILGRAAVPITPADTAQTLHDRLAALGAGLLVETLARLERGQVVPVHQDAAAATYAPKLSKDEARIDWGQPAAVLARRVRAFNPWPVAGTRWAGRALRVWEAAGAAGPTLPARPPGTVLAAGEAGIVVQTGEGALALTRLQIEGGRALPARDFLNGHPIGPGDRLG